MKVRRILISALSAAAALVCFASDAEAAGSAHGFAEKGQLYISADRLVPLFSYTTSSITRTQNNTELTTSESGTGISLLFGRNLAGGDGRTVVTDVHAIPRVAFDVAIIDHLTVGAALAFGFGLGGTYEEEQLNGATITTRKADLPTASAIGFAPRVGYVLPLTDMFAFWPRAGIGFYSVSTGFEQVNGVVVDNIKQTDTIFSLDLDPQFALVPFEHFFLHAGPVVNIPISGSRSLTTTRGATTTEVTFDASLFHLGLSAGMGLYFDVF